MRSNQPTVSIKDLVPKNSSSASKDAAFFEFWQSYNSAKAEAELEDTYTPHFMIDHKLTQFLNQISKSILQLGAANGGFIETYKNKGWNVLGYDYSPNSIKCMVEKNVPARLVNLNSLNSGSEEQLKKDIQKYSNVFMFRILNYLDIKSLTNLLHLMINHSLPGTVFFIGDIIKEDKQYEETFPETKRNFKTSFFAARTDMEFFRDKIINLDLDEQTDELIVVRKRV